MTKFLDIVDSVNEWMGRVLSYGLVLLTLVVTYEVIMRYFFNRPSSWGFEVSVMMLLTLICLGGGYTLLHGAHVKVDILYDRFSPRQKAIIDLISYPVLFLICLALIWYGGQVFLLYLREGYISESAWGEVLWPSKIMIPIAGVLLGLQCLAKWIRDWVMVVKGIKLQSKVVSGEGGLRG